MQDSLVRVLLRRTAPNVAPRVIFAGIALISRAIIAAEMAVEAIMPATKEVATLLWATPEARAVAVAVIPAVVAVPVLPTAVAVGHTADPGKRGGTASTATVAASEAAGHTVSTADGRLDQSDGPWWRCLVGARRRAGGPGWRPG